tara:strand:+ start:940 stop:2490 length:1551 start_codon:yes stop_codon:yes gene_type:complete
MEEITEIEQISLKCGNIDEAGILNSFKQQGFTSPKCINELIANSIDAHASEIRFSILDEDNMIQLMDNGVGMSQEDCVNFASIQKQNHRTDKSKGICGIGAKAATYLLSNKSTVHIYTHKQNNNYYQITIPWNIMFELGRYTDMVSVKTMTLKEIVNYKETYSSYFSDDTFTGTIISFEYNKELAHHIRASFSKNHSYAELIEGEEIERVQIPLIDRMGIVFGKESSSVKIQFEDENIYFYDYFCSTVQDDYYETSYIKVYYDEEDDEYIYILRMNGKSFECCKTKKKITSKGDAYKQKYHIKNKTSSLEECPLIGTFTLECGMRSEELDIIKELDSSFFLGTYNTDYITDTDIGNEFILRYKLYRNNQFIGLVHGPADIKESSARANVLSNIRQSIVQLNICYEQVSEQVNKMDTLVGIQQNKNQYHDDLIDIRLRRLCRIVRESFADKLIYAYEKVNKNIETALQPTVVETYDQSSLIAEHQAALDSLLELEGADLSQSKLKKLSKATQIIKEL